MINLDIAQNVATQFFLSTPYQGTKKFLACTNTDSNITQWKDQENYHSSSLSLKPSNSEHLNQFNKANPENGNDTEKNG